MLCADFSKAVKTRGEKRKRKHFLNFKYYSKMKCFVNTIQKRKDENINLLMSFDSHNVCSQNVKYFNICKLPEYIFAFTIYTQI